MPMEKIYLASSFNDAMKYVYRIPGEARKVVLIENDLTDNY